MQNVYEQLDKAMQNSPLTNLVTTSDYQGILEAHEMKIERGEETVEQAIEDMCLLCERCR